MCYWIDVESRDYRKGMRCRTYVAILLVNTTAVLFLYRPWPLLDFIGNTAEISIVVMLFGVSILLLWSTVPKPRIDPTGKAVFITGCDNEFDVELAQRLNRMGYHVFAGCQAIDGVSARSLKECTSGRLKLVPVDVTDEAQVQQAVKFVITNIGNNKLWAVVNNPGTAVDCFLDWRSMQMFQKILDVNVLGIVRVTLAFIPLLQQSEGRIVNVTSVADQLSMPALAAYSMSKTACIAFSDCLRQWMQDYNITVITIEPGLFKSPINQESNLRAQSRKYGREAELGTDTIETFLDVSQNDSTVAFKQTCHNSQEVIDNIIEAVCAQHPSHHYAPGWMSRLRVFIGFSSLKQNVR